MTSNLFETFTLPRPVDAFGVQLWEASTQAPWTLTEPARVLVEPLIALFQWGRGWRGMIHALLAALWAIAVWGIIGGAISRLALVEVCRMRRLGAWAAVRFAIRYAVALVGTPLCVLLAVALCALGCAGFGLLYRLPAGIGGVLGGIFLFVPLALGLVMSLLILGLAAAWPLMHASVAAEAEDTLDALSRTLQLPESTACDRGLLGGRGVASRERGIRSGRGVRLQRLAPGDVGYEPDGPCVEPGGPGLSGAGSHCDSTHRRLVSSLLARRDHPVRAQLGLRLLLEQCVALVPADPAHGRRHGMERD